MRRKNCDALAVVFDSFIFVDLETSELVIVDWKTMTKKRDATLVFLDGQLQLYATAFSQLGVDISRVCMWEMRKNVPHTSRMQFQE